MTSGSNQLLELAALLSKNIESSDETQISKKRKYNELSKTITNTQPPTYEKKINLVKYKCGMYLDYINPSELNIDSNLNYYVVHTTKFYHINGKLGNLYYHTVDSYICYLAEDGILYTIINNILCPFIHNHIFHIWKFRNMITTRYYAYVDILFDSSFIFRKYNFKKSPIYNKVTNKLDHLYFCGRLINGNFIPFVFNNNFIYDGLLGNDNTIYSIYGNDLLPVVVNNRSYLWQFVF